jgi:TolB-like protein
MFSGGAVIVEPRGATRQPHPANYASPSLGRQDTDWLAVISEDIITDLSKLSELHVIARDSSFVFKAGALSIREVARDLGVRYVLEGSLRKAGLLA